MLRLARRSAPLIAFALLALAAWSWWPAAWPPWSRWLAPLLLLFVVLLLRRVAWEPRARTARGPRSLTLDESVRLAAAEWDARHGAPDEAEPEPATDVEPAPWRASLGPAWEGDDADEDEEADDDEERWRGARR